jgi:hypothetical protein
MAFAKVRMDLVGLLPTAQGNCKFAVVAVDYFTKWVDAKALANITAPTIQKFFWQNIVCRFGVPREWTLIMRSNSTVTPSKNTARLWALTRRFHQYIIHNLMGLSKEQMG